MLRRAVEGSVISNPWYDFSLAFGVFVLWELWFIGIKAFSFGRDILSVMESSIK